MVKKSQMELGDYKCRHEEFKEYSHGMLVNESSMNCAWFFPLSKRGEINKRNGNTNTNKKEKEKEYYRVPTPERTNDIPLKVQTMFTPTSPVHASVAPILLSRSF